MRAAPTARQASRQVTARLAEAGFLELGEAEDWNLEAGGKYFVRREDTALAAFALPGRGTAVDGWNVAVAHLDSPGLKLRLEALADNPLCGTLTGRVEVYGGPILATWLDRPLRVAGSVSIRTDAGLQTREVTLDQPVAVIPNLAIHMNREVNKGFEYNPQEHLHPVFAADGGKPETIAHMLAEEAGLPDHAVVAADLYLCPVETGCVAGCDQSLIVAPRLDNLAMCEAALTGLVASSDPGRAAMAVFFDHEEVGSRTATGADSAFLRSVMLRRAFAEGGGEVEFLRGCAHSFLISADMAHAVHPAFAGKHDHSSAPKINGGPVIKAHAGRKYTTTAASAARFAALCAKAGVRVQNFTPRSDQPTGSTVGPFVSAELGMPSVDVGNPLWAMHSCVETAGVHDHAMMTAVFRQFFTSGVD
jgi:aspartyl aminopeptidase